MYCFDKTMANRAGRVKNVQSMPVKNVFSHILKSTLTPQSIPLESNESSTEKVIDSFSVSLVHAYE